MQCFSRSLSLSHSHSLKMWTGTRNMLSARNYNSTTVMHAMTICITYSLYSVSLNNIKRKKNSYLYSDLLFLVCKRISLYTPIISVCNQFAYWTVFAQSKNHAKIIHFVGPLFEFIIRYVFQNQQIAMLMKLLSDPF